MLRKNNVVSVSANSRPYEIHFNCFQMFYFPRKSFYFNSLELYIFFPFFILILPLWSVCISFLGRRFDMLNCLGRGRRIGEVTLVWSNTLVNPCNFLPRQKHSSCSRNQNFSQITVTFTIFHASQWILFLLANSMILSTVLWTCKCALQTNMS